MCEAQIHLSECRDVIITDIKLGCFSVSVFIFDKFCTEAPLLFSLELPEPPLLVPAFDNINFCGQYEAAPRVVLGEAKIWPEARRRSEKNRAETLRLRKSQ